MISSKIAKIKTKLLTKSNFFLAGIIILGFLLSLPSFSLFFTHDDFFHFKIAQVSSTKDFLNFFSPTHAPENWAHYRPLTTQVFYAIGRYFFNFHPFPMRLLSFSFFVLTIILIKKIISLLTEDDFLALISSFFYATSATNFSKIYFLATQELGLAVFFLLSTLFFIKFLLKKNKNYYWLALLTFVISLTAKETAAVLPAILLLTSVFLKNAKKTTVKFSTTILYLIPFSIILAIYSYLHIFKYGLPKGNSYIYDFSPRILNTTFWYLLWSLNIPEMLVDFVGPGFHFLPALFKYYSNEIIPILTVFILQSLLLFLSAIILFFKRNFYVKSVIFSIIWFMITLFPVIFLPWHKFTIYLTLPMFSISFFLALVAKGLKQIKSTWSNILIITFSLVFSILSIMTSRLTYKTNWIVQGAKTAKRVNLYLQQELKNKENIKEIVFYDTPEDENLPWKPSQVLKTVLSDNNFFEVFYNGKPKAVYTNTKPKKKYKNQLLLKARQFLGY